MKTVVNGDGRGFLLRGVLGQTRFYLDQGIHLRSMREARSRMVNLLVTPSVLLQPLS